MESNESLKSSFSGGRSLIPVDEMIYQIESI